MKQIQNLLSSIIKPEVVVLYAFSYFYYVVGLEICAQNNGTLAAWEFPTKCVANKRKSTTVSHFALEPLLFDYRRGKYLTIHCCKSP